MKVCVHWRLLVTCHQCYTEKIFWFPRNHCSRLQYWGGGGTHIGLVYLCVPAFWGVFFMNFGKAMGVSSQMKASNLHKLGVF